MQETDTIVIVPTVKRTKTMPKIVGKVPDPWEPYRDGHIWEFTEDEYLKMPGARVMSDSVSGEIFGSRMITWCRDGKYYVRFMPAGVPFTEAEAANWEQQRITGYAELTITDEMDNAVGVYVVNLGPDPYSVQFTTLPNEVHPNTLDQHKLRIAVRKVQ